MAATSAVVVLILGINAASKTNAAGENVKEFRDMCNFYNLLKQKIPEPHLTGADGKTTQPMQEEKKATMKLITALNITTLPTKIEAFLGQLKAQAAGADLRKEDPGKAFFGGATDDVLELILTEYRALQKGPNGDGFKKKYNVPLSPAAKDKLAKPLSRLALQAEGVANAIQSKLTAITTLRQQARQDALKALYGSKKANAATAADADPDTEITQPTDAQHFPFTSAGRETYCKPGNANDLTAGDALAGDIVCLCSGGDSDSGGGNDYCTATGVNTLAKITTATATSDALRNYKLLTAECEKMQLNPPIQPSGANLLAAATAVLSHLGANFMLTGTAPTTTGFTRDSHNFLGVHVVNNANTPTCDATHDTPATTEAKGVCIDYTKRLQKAAQIPWQAAATSMAAKLNNIDKLFAETTADYQRLKTLQHQMETTLLLAELATAASTSGASPATSAHKPSKTNTCIPQNNTASECPETECDYDAKAKDGIKCKPKPGTEKTAATPAAGSTTVNCAGHNKKIKCEEENKGKTTPVCGWRKGKDNKPDQDKEMCRNGSVLVNKKIYLMACFLSSVVM
uniref:Variant surface glycoprotein 1125.4014 n=1 Tax=Trypanosoma brucei TaxID=5691 RepID=A0A1J0R9S3_9TRYP|nr:variant surface glycoprotein 1125.4014 [Trypanosoma brucei]